MTEIVVQRGMTHDADKIDLRKIKSITPKRNLKWLGQGDPPHDYIFFIEMFTIAGERILFAYTDIEYGGEDYRNLRSCWEEVTKT